MITDGPLLLKEDDPRVQQVRSSNTLEMITKNLLLSCQIQRITERIVSILDENETHSRIVSAVWPPPEPRTIIGNVNAPQLLLHQAYPPSARAVSSASIPFVLESANPTKVFESSDWKLYIVDLVCLDVAFTKVTKC